MKKHDVKGNILSINENFEVVILKCYKNKERKLNKTRIESLSLSGWGIITIAMWGRI